LAGASLKKTAETAYEAGLAAAPEEMVRSELLSALAKAIWLIPRRWPDSRPRLTLDGQSLDPNQGMRSGSN